MLTVGSPIGRKVRPRFVEQGAPLIRVKTKDLVGRGVELVPRVAGVRDGLPLLADDRTLPVENVVWCTGFRNTSRGSTSPCSETGASPYTTAGS